MTTYITAADVDATLGPGWEGAGDKARAVLEANAWLTAHNVVAGDPVEADIVTAGSYLAQEAAAGKLYADTQGDLKRKMVDADGVKSEKEYQDGAKAQSGVVTLALDLIQPYLAGAGSVFAVRRG